MALERKTGIVQASIQPVTRLGESKFSYDDVECICKHSLTKESNALLSKPVNPRPASASNARLSNPEKPRAPNASKALFSAEFIMISPSLTLLIDGAGAALILWSGAGMRRFRVFGWRRLVPRCLTAIVVKKSSVTILRQRFLVIAAAAEDGVWLVAPIIC